MARSKAQKKLGGARIDGDGPRQAKADAVDEVQKRVQEASAVVLTEYRGLTVQELADLRAGLMEAGAEYKVYKNTLARIATTRLGLDGLTAHLEGPTAFTFTSGDPVLAAKALAGFAKKVEALVLKAGLLDGRILTADEVSRLAELDSREVMLARTAGLLQAPLQRAASLFAAGFQQLGSLLAQLRATLPPEATDAAEPADAPPSPEGASTELEPGPEPSTPEAAVEGEPDGDQAPGDEQPPDVTPEG